MTIRRILVPIRGDGKGEGVLDHAVSLARRFKAHVDVLHCRPRPEDMLPFGVSVPAMLRKDILASTGTVADQEERKVRDLFDAYCERNDLTLVDGPPGPEDRLSLSWREESGKQATVIAVQGPAWRSHRRGAAGSGAESGTEHLGSGAAGNRQAGALVSAAGG